MQNRNRIISFRKQKVAKEEVDLSQIFSVPVGQPYATQITNSSLLLKWTAPEDSNNEYVVERKR